MASTNLLPRTASRDIRPRKECLQQQRVVFTKVGPVIISDNGRFVKHTATMGALASQSEIGVWVQAPLRVDAGEVAPFRCGSPRVSPPDNVATVYAQSCNLVHFGSGKGSQFRP